MSRDNRRDAGEYYPGGKVVETVSEVRARALKRTDFEDMNLDVATIGGLKAAVRSLAQKLGATVVTSLALAFAANAAEVQTAPLADLDIDAASVVTNVDLSGLATSADLAATNAATLAAAKLYADSLPAPDFSTNNAALVATIAAVAPSGGSAAPEAVRLWTVRDEGGAFTLRRESAAALDGATNLCAVYYEGGRFVLKRVAAFDPAALEILADYDRSRRRFMFYVIK